MTTEDRGFSLVEVLVALVIVTVTLTGFYRLLTNSLHARSSAALREVALNRAATHLEHVGIDLPAATGSGTFDDGLQWHLSATRFAPRRGPSSVVDFIWLELVISDRDGQSLARLETGKAILEPP